ncbi:OLC1v1020269C1 [Oldenlandia corymbosa var. corymbosa]|uniref:OLC1v1020269C1 n=1 Tax=Oldenlandia corymbosa var. corymbosa TaxID=529605 RepID=A0AAV1EGJ3_OLDCO|nr:OLC1v1020269C1 [Oldenlandia corymbosa var. corymbosa]
MNRKLDGAGEASSSKLQLPVPGTLQSKYRQPWLVYFHGRGRRHNQTFCDLSSSSSPSSGVIAIPKRIPELGNDRRVLYCSPDGDWLLLQEKNCLTQSFFLWNPTTQEDSIKLPLLRHFLQEKSIHQGLLLLSSSNPNPLVILFVLELCLILYCRVGDRRWTEFDYAERIESQTGLPFGRDYYLCSPVVFDGEIYATASCYTDFVVFDGEIYATASCYTDLLRIHIDDDNNCEVIVLSEHPSKHLNSPPCKSSRGIFLVPIGDELFRILISPDFFDRYGETLSITISKFDFSSKLWKTELQPCLNGGSVFLCNFYSLYCSNSGGGLDDGWSYIYFTVENDQNLFSYRVEDGRLTSYSILPTVLQGSWISQWIMAHVAPPPEPDVLHCYSDMLLQPSDAVDPWKEREQEISWRNRVRTQKRLKTLESETVGNLEAMKSETFGNFGSPSLCDLSQEVLGLISENLSFVDYMLFRCVNKVCSSATIRMRVNSFPPCLIYKDSFYGVYNIVDSNLNHKISINVSEALKNYVICCSRGGWLLMRYESDYVFFNPLTSQVVRVGGKPNLGCSIMNFTFLNKPSSPDCTILTMAKFSESSRRPHFVQRCPQLGAMKWWTLMAGEQGIQRSFDQNRNSPVQLGEFCYYLSDDGRVARIKFAADGQSSFHWEILSIRVLPVSNVRLNYLTDCGGKLVAILIGDKSGGNKPWIRVFKLKEFKKWEEIHQLEGYSLCLSWSSSISVLTETPEMANRIYFPKFYKDELVYYSLDTKTYHSVGSQHDLESLNETSMYMDCAWIEPSWN